MLKQLSYKPLQFYSVEDRLKIIRKHIQEGMGFDEIGNLFGVGGAAIRYHYKRYFLKDPLVKKPHAPALRSKPAPRPDPYTEYLKELGRAGLL